MARRPSTVAARLRARAATTGTTVGLDVRIAPVYGPDMRGAA